MSQSSEANHHEIPARGALWKNSANALPEQKLCLLLTTTYEIINASQEIHKGSNFHIDCWFVY
jgi:hypothetical protein